MKKALEQNSPFSGDHLFHFPTYSSSLEKYYPHYYSALMTSSP
ncbi:hypothetical protein LINPERHAP2_LOCUS34355, partial [Linum perenne]